MNKQKVKLITKTGFSKFSEIDNAAAKIIVPTVRKITITTAEFSNFDFIQFIETTFFLVKKHKKYWEYREDHTSTVKVQHLN